MSNLPVHFLFPELLEHSTSESHRYDDADEDLEIGAESDYNPFNPNDAVEHLHNPEFPDDDDDAADMNTWDVLVSRALASATNVLHIPRYISDNCFYDDQDQITLVDELTDKLYDCQIMGGNKTDSNARYIGMGFYQFVRESELKEGDKLSCTVTVPPDFLEVIITRLEDLP
ncbi:hypothetical protein P8452_69455 [Trifolium repens]|nr:hypothetical protein P8452_69455 [Trifolium repens]